MAIKKPQVGFYDLTVDQNFTIFHNSVGKFGLSSPSLKSIATAAVNFSILDNATRTSQDTACAIPLEFTAGKRAINLRFLGNFRGSKAKYRYGCGNFFEINRGKTRSIKDMLYLTSTTNARNQFLTQYLKRRMGFNPS